MTWEMAFVLIVVLLMLAGLIFEVARPDIIMFITLTILMLTGILTPAEALKGFSNQGMLTIALLFIVVGAVQKTDLIDRLMTKILNSDHNHRRVMSRFLFPASGISGFLNNTPIVVAFTPVIRKWCIDHNISPSKFLIPLSYATIMGGMITLMGTSTNLVVHGLLIDATGEGFSIFQLAFIGVPVTIVGIVYLVTIGYRLLPDRKVLTEKADRESREYLSEVLVEPNYPFIGKTVEQAGLRHLQGLFLVSIVRGKEKISPVKSSTKIQAGDRLIFTGLISTLAELQRNKGLKMDTGTDLSLDTIKNGDSQLVEVVVSHQSHLAYKTVKETGFRGRYDAAVLAVHRKHERIKSKIGDITLKPGDTLLLLTGPDFKNRMNHQDFYVVTPIYEPKLMEDSRQTWFSLGILTLMIFLVTFNMLSMFKAATLAVVLMLIFRMITPDEAKQSVQFNVLLLIASAFGIGEAMVKTGLAQFIASNLVSVVQPFGIIAFLFMIYVLTNVFTEMITNNAAAVIMFPIAMEMAHQIHINPMAAAVTIAIAASASFVTPIGYQTNMIVYGPGGYRFMDYVKVGLPLSFMTMVITIFIVHLVWV
ncbi:di/tricarboxylate transporter [Melghiribacillus thermohalophilus]|uniref:Di/tricarboxylate transporter n=1 Tax=Melghiribacillus thermohalophilus TaxID=1324956 RepID=A0A4R3NDB9_9BACI|nr:SLC13 family permease [Melghiribacillus thermohalophilus]TCT26470.1 di/tricarboxylate transporter [Melghiribacillus thermohalophilus]